MILWVNLGLLLLHEMDAVRTTEWKMTAFINRLDENLASGIFISVHFIMFLAVFYMLEYHFMALYWFTSIFPLFHHLLHICFRKHPANRMNNPFSQSIIILMTVFSSAGIIFGLSSNY